LGKLSQCAAKSLSKFFKLILGKKTGISGIVVAIQTFGDYVRWHPHLHALVADGWPEYDEAVFDFKKLKDRQWIHLS
jgi:hypothetical protein